MRGYAIRAMDQRTPSSPKAYPAQKARQGIIILRERWQQAVFIAGLAGCAIVGLIVYLLR